MRPIALLRPILKPQPFDQFEISCISRDERQIVREGDGRDAQVHRADSGPFVSDEIEFFLCRGIERDERERSECIDHAKQQFVAFENVRGLASVAEKGVASLCLFLITDDRHANVPVIVANQIGGQCGKVGTALPFSDADVIRIEQMRHDSFNPGETGASPPSHSSSGSGIGSPGFQFAGASRPV